MVTPRMVPSDASLQAFSPAAKVPLALVLFGRGDASALRRGEHRAPSKKTPKTHSQSRRKFDPRRERPAAAARTSAIELLEQRAQRYIVDAHQIRHDQIRAGCEQLGFGVAVTDGDAGQAS